jgi:hypothetical protein
MLQNLIIKGFIILTCKFYQNTCLSREKSQDNDFSVKNNFSKAKTLHQKGLMFLFKIYLKEATIILSEWG